jgi:hypothetical protein
LSRGGGGRNPERSAPKISSDILGGKRVKWIRPITFKSEQTLVWSVFVKSSERRVFVLEFDLNL